MQEIQTITTQKLFNKSTESVRRALSKIFAQYKDSTGRDLPCYRFPKREACLMAMSYSYELQATVFDRMTELEGGQDINLLDLSGLTELTIKQMQDRVALAEKHSFTEHGQKVAA